MDQFQWLFGRLEEGLYCEVAIDGAYKGIAYVNFGVYVNKKTLDWKLRSLLNG